MKRYITFLLVILVSIITLTGCEFNKNSGTFTLTCEGVDNSSKGVKSTDKSVYNFNKDQLLTDYNISIVSVYDDENTYKIYKESALEAAKVTDGSSLAYDVKTDDKTKTIDFSYKMKMTEKIYKGAKDKNYYKAKNVLKRAESNPKAKCSFEGIKKSQLK